MKKIRVLLLVLMFSSFAAAAEFSVTLRYSYVFDMWCSSHVGSSVTQDEVNGLYTVFPTLQSAWTKTGPGLVNALETTMRKSFLQREFIATVFLCKNTPSMSMPLLINGNWFYGPKAQDPDLVVDIIFHELLHTFIVDHFPKLYNSSMFTKYRSEDPGVLSHLHLMALQKKVYLSLGLKERIENVIRFDSEHYRGAYKRSWEIVNLEGEDAFFQDLLTCQ